MGVLVLGWEAHEAEERRKELRTERWFNAAAYAWRVVANVFYVLVILYVFSRLSERFETIVVALFGIIYVTLRSVGTGIVVIFGQFGIALQKELDSIKMMVDPSHEPPPLDFVERRTAVARRKMYIDVGFLTLVSLICLWRLFSVL